MPNTRRLIFLSLSIPNGGTTRPYDEFCSGVTAEWKAITWELHMAFLSSCLDFTTSTSWRCSRLFDAKGYFRSRASRYPNSTSTFQLIPLSVSGDISLNPGTSNFKLQSHHDNMKSQQCENCSSKRSLTQEQGILCSCKSRGHRVGE